MRHISLALISRERVRGKSFLLEKGYDSVKDEYFYRPLGGGVECNEKANEALVREFKEELNIDILVMSFLGNIESIFEYEGQKGHEFVSLYNACLVRRNLYKQDYFKRCDNDIGQAVWKSLLEVDAEECKLYPIGIREYMCS